MPQAGSLQRSPACGATNLVITLISTRGVKYCPGAGFLLRRVFLQKALVQIAEALFLGAVPIKLVDGRDDLLQILGLVDICLRAGVDLADAACAVFAEMVEKLFIELLELQYLSC